MGWASGSEMASDIWALFRKYVPEKSRKRVARELVSIFEMQDCDTMDEAERLMKDAGLENRWQQENDE
jgi:hypothetical protein